MEQPFPYELDRRPRFPESVTIAVPRGTRARIRAEAAARGVTTADFGRRILDEHLAPPPEGLLVGESQILRRPDTESALLSISPQDVAQTWADFMIGRAVLAANRKLPGAPFEPDTLRRACEVGKHQLWLAVDGAKAAGIAVTSILIEEGGDKVLLWQLVTGYGFARWRWCREHIEQWGREQGCRRARAYGRPGWQRIGLDDYSVTGLIFERGL